MPKLTQAEKYLAKRILLEEADRTEENGRKWAEAAEAGVRTAEERMKFREVAAYRYKTAEKIRGIVGKIESEKKNKPSEVRSMMNILDLEPQQWIREEHMRATAPKALALAERVLEAATELNATLKDIEDAQRYLTCWVTEFRDGTDAQTIRAYRRDFLEGPRAEEAMRCVSEWRQSEERRRGRPG